MTLKRLRFARGCYHGLRRSTTVRSAFATPPRNVDFLSPALHVKLRRSALQFRVQAFSLGWTTTNLKVEL